MTITTAIHVALELWGMLFCLAAFLGLLFGRELETENKKVFGALLLTDAFQLFMDTIAWCFRGNVTDVGYHMVRFSNYMLYATNYVLIFLFTLYFLDYVKLPDYRVGDILKYKKFMFHLLLIGLFVLTIGQVSDVFYGFTADNCYYRGRYWMTLMGIGFIGMFVDAIVLIAFRKYIVKDMFLCFLSYLILPFVAMVVQSLIYGYSLMNLAVTISLIAMYIATRTIQSRELIDNERMLGDMRIQIAVSQIGPHFLFNALTTIKFLCQIDPQRAAKAVDDLAVYFRGNLDALTSKECISFEKEIEHVKHFLVLEKERFRDRINIDWEIEETGFSLPPLTIQPLVENALKYGILKRIEGGTVVIHSERVEDGFKVVIQDDGVGFDPGKMPEDGRSHVGIINVRERIQEMCGGRFDISSTIGKGTRCEIWVPKEVKKV